MYHRLRGKFLKNQRIHLFSRTGTVLLAVSLIAMVASTAHAQGPVRAGIEIPYKASSPHPYPTGQGEAPVWSLAIEHPGATYIAVHFDRFDLGPGDRLVIRSESGLQRHLFTGKGRSDLGTFWAAHIKGDRAVLELISPNPGAGSWGVSIDKFAAGIVDLGSEATELVCFGDDREHAICYQTSEPEIYANARPVARLLLAGTFLCTGWLVGCEGHLITNNHCIDDPGFGGLTPAQVVANTNYEFLAEAPNCSDPKNQFPAYPGNLWGGTPTLIQNSSSLDMAFIHLAGNPQDTYGALFLEDRLPTTNERIYFPQHPGGRGKEVGVFSDAPADTSGFCEVDNPAGGSCGFPGEPPNVRYYCDSEGGSSGSPILSYANHGVVALHHCGGCTNTGVPIPNIITALGSDLPSCAILGDPLLVFDSVVIHDDLGNKNGFADPFEIPMLEVNLLNDGAGRAGNVSGVLSTTTPGITIHDNTASWPTIQALLSEGTEDPHFEFEIATSVPCGTLIDFDLAVTTDFGPFNLAFQVPVGNGGSCSGVPCFTLPAAVAVPDPICEGSMTTLDASASGEFGEDCSGTLEYRFEIGGLLLQDWSTDATAEVTPPASTVYTVKVRDQVTLVQDSAFPPITLLLVPTASITQTVDPVCIEFDSVTLDSVAGMSSYIWRDDLDQVVGTSQQVVLDATSCGRTYTVEVDNGNGCTDTAMHTVACTVCAPEEVSASSSVVPFRFGIDAAASIEFELLPDNAVVYDLWHADSMASMLAGSWTTQFCDLEATPLGTWNLIDAVTVQWTPIIPAILSAGHFVVVAQSPEGVEGPYGFQTGGLPRTPDADGVAVTQLNCP